MLDRIALQPEHKELLGLLVEAHRAVPRAQRREFLFIRTFGGDSILHDGLAGGSLESSASDLRGLAHAGLIDLRQSSRTDWSFDVTPTGFAYYDQLRQATGQSTERVEASLRSYLDGQQFQQQHPLAYQKWLDAEALLWGSDSERQLTTIGHLCREAMQAFATGLIECYRPADAPNDRAKDVARIRAVLNQRSAQLPTTVKPFLDALLAYWGTVSDLVQRQEHGSQRENQVLSREDGRRVVFQTAIVMFEINQALAYLK